MGHRWTQLYVHLVWSTWRRFPLITPDIQSRLYGALHHQATQMGADVVAIGGISDHVHVLTRFPANVALADLVQRMKGASSHFVTHVLKHETAFKWQGGYGAFTLTKRAVPHVRLHVLNQEAHHRNGTTFRALERDEG